MCSPRCRISSHLAAMLTRPRLNEQGVGIRARLAANRKIPFRVPASCPHGVTAVAYQWDTRSSSSPVSVCGDGWAQHGPPRRGSRPPTLRAGARLRVARRVIPPIYATRFSPNGSPLTHQHATPHVRVRTSRRTERHVNPQPNIAPPVRHRHLPRPNPLFAAVAPCVACGLAPGRHGPRRRLAARPAALSQRFGASRNQPPASKIGAITARSPVPWLWKIAPESDVHFRAAPAKLGGDALFFFVVPFRSSAWSIGRWLLGPRRDQLRVPRVFQRIRSDPRRLRHSRRRG